MLTAAIDLLRTLGILQTIQVAAVVGVSYYLYHKFFGN